MVDFKGQELNVGDKVLVIHKTYHDPVQCFKEGTIIRMTPYKVEVEFIIPGMSQYKIPDRKMTKLKGNPELCIFKLG